MQWCGIDSFKSPISNKKPRKGRTGKTTKLSDEAVAYIRRIDQRIKRMTGEDRILKSYIRGKVKEKFGVDVKEDTIYRICRYLCR